MLIKLKQHIAHEISDPRLSGDAYRRLLILCALLVSFGTMTAISGDLINSSRQKLSQAERAAILLAVPQMRREGLWEFSAHSHKNADKFLPSTEAPDTLTEPPTEEFVPDGSLPVVMLKMTPSASSEHYGNVYVHNEAKKQYDGNSLLEAVPDIRLDQSGSVQVLIYHTHGTEGYNEQGHSYYGNDFYSTRSKDTSVNVVHIGDVLAEVLESYGIGVIHDRTMYDDPQYTGAYLLSGAAAEKNLEKYPTISLVIDLHRDTLITSSGTKYRPVAQTEYGPTAQMMLIAACGKTSDPNKHWQENLRLTLHLQKHAERLYPTLMRPILLRNSMYNQHLSVGAFLAEIGSCGNTITEAENAAKCLADIIIDTLAE